MFSSFTDALKSASAQKYDSSKKNFRGMDLLLES